MCLLSGKRQPAKRCVALQTAVSVGRPRGSVQKRPTGVISKPANGSGSELLKVVPDRELSKQGKSGLFPQSFKKKTHSEVRCRVFSKSPMVLVMAFPAPR